MTTEIPIKNLRIADDSELRSMSVKLGSKYIFTPFRSILTNDFYSETQFPEELSKVNEIFFRLDEEKLDRFNKDLNYSKEINKKAEKSKKFLPDSESICLVEFKNKSESHQQYPTQNQIKSLINIAYSFSDIVPIPSVPKAARGISLDNFDDFMGYLKSCYEIIMVRNKKRLMGYIPVVPQFFVEDIIDFYIDRGINGFYIDFDGTMVNSHLTTINAIKRRLAERGYEENNFLYYVNISYGKAINQQNVLSARDILAFGHGLDGFGGIHVAPKRGKEFYEWIKKKGALENIVRLLNREDYGYYRVNSPNTNLEHIFPSESIYELAELQEATESRSKRLTSIINLQQQSLEGKNLKNLIDEDPNKTIKYFDSKTMVKKDDIKLLSKTTKSKTLSDFFI